MDYIIAPLEIDIMIRKDKCDQVCDFKCIGYCPCFDRVYD